MFIVYVLFNRDQNKIYIGQTNDLQKRLLEHNYHLLGGYTSRYCGEWEIIYQENINSREQALKREKQLKSFRGREFVKRYIPG